MFLENVRSRGLPEKLMRTGSGLKLWHIERHSKSKQVFLRVVLVFSDNSRAENVENAEAKHSAFPGDFKLNPLCAEGVGRRRELDFFRSSCWFLVFRSLASYCRKKVCFLKGAVCSSKFSKTKT